MNASVIDVAFYLNQYVKEYRQEYERFIATPPNGGGYPRLDISPYLYSPEIQCYLAKNGFAIVDFSREPEYDWWIIGGPAILVDLLETRTPPEIVEFLKSEGVYGKPIGIYRIVAKEGMTDEIWQGQLSEVVDSVEEVVDGKTKIKVQSYDIDRISLIQRLTFGAFGLILDLKLPDQNISFWNPHIIRDLGVATADRRQKRFFHYLELSPHLCKCAWDARNISTRIQVDVRRDFAYAFSKQSAKGGSISFGKSQIWAEHFYDRLSALELAIRRFSDLLENQSAAEEQVFHEFLKKHPILLDVYGEVISKPRFVYPKGESPLGKEYVEPDFIVIYPENSYKLVEIEKPSKKIATQQGQPRHEVSQSAFQIAEWTTYIHKHYDQLKANYPGIVINCKTMIVISRISEENFGAGRDVHKYMELIKGQFSVDEVLTYDDLLQRARDAYLRLSSLVIRP